MPHDIASLVDIDRGLIGRRIYIEPDRDDFITQLNLVDDPQAARPFERACPGQWRSPGNIMEGLR